MWDELGLEAVAEIPDPALDTWAALTDTKPPSRPNLNAWQLRARFNSQRHYEIYVIMAKPDIAIQDIRSMFEQDPQNAANTIRRLGKCFYSNRRQQQLQDIQIT